LKIEQKVAMADKKQMAGSDNKKNGNYQKNMSASHGNGKENMRRNKHGQLANK
jgi:hypothetical protein